jgi:1,4-dihydroxy-2-naphthoate octaprenyltransferase
MSTTPQNHLSSFHDNIRMGAWWLYKAAPLLALLYIMVYVNRIPFIDAFYHFAASIITIIGIAGFGYFLNDLADIEFDKAAGKRNRVGGLGIPARIGLAVLLLALSFLPWLYLQSDWLTWALMGFQFLLYIIYSFQPFRLKEKGWGGIICDALYGLAVPAMIALLTFDKIVPSRFLHFRWFLVVLFVALVLKGFRNILLHQLDDRHNDRQSGMSTFVTSTGSLFSLNFINRIILPLEGVALLGMVWILSLNLPGFHWVLVAFTLYVFLKFSGWKFFGMIPFRQLRFKFLFFMNDFYEEWLGVAALGYLIAYSPWFSILLVFHLIMFSGLLKKLGQDLKKIWINLTVAD